MRALIRLIPVALLFASQAGAQTRADTLAIFDAAAKKMGMGPEERLSAWFVNASDSLTASFAAHHKQPTQPIPRDTVYCGGGSAREGDISGHIVSVRLKFTGPSKAYLTIANQCTMRRAETWGFMSGDTVALELRDGVWVATSHSVFMS
jgi:hypothetical protein